MPFLKVAIHAVWGTKYRLPLMDYEIRKIVCNHILENAKLKNIWIDTINGYTDHLHCLFHLNADLSIAKALQLLKGESSFWANKNLKFNEHFGWQDDYFAVSVSQSHFDIVNNYISNQEEHHRKKTFQEEYDEFIKNYNFES